MFQQLPNGNSRIRYWHLPTMTIGSDIGFGGELSSLAVKGRNIFSVMYRFLCKQIKHFACCFTPPLLPHSESRRRQELRVGADSLRASKDRSMEKEHRSGSTQLSKRMKQTGKAYACSIDSGETRFLSAKSTDTNCLDTPCVSMRRKKSVRMRSPQDSLQDHDD